MSFLRDGPGSSNISRVCRYRQRKGQKCSVVVQKASVLFSRWRDRTVCLPTGSLRLNELLGGGILTGEVTEIIGASASGKTQICMMLSAAVVRNTRSSVLYIDAAGSFSVDRFMNLLNVRLEQESTTSMVLASMMKRIHVRRFATLFGVLQLLETIAQKGRSALPMNTLVIIIDCIGTLLSVAIFGKQRLGMQYIMRVGGLCRKVACEHGLAVILTNNTVKASSASDARKPALGRWWSTHSSTRVFLRRHVPMSTMMVGVSILKSSRATPKTEFAMRISNSGVNDDTYEESSSDDDDDEVEQKQTNADDYFS